jgi:hypothetical protein
LLFPRWQLEQEEEEEDLTIDDIVDDDADVGDDEVR